MNINFVSKIFLLLISIILFSCSKEIQTLEHKENKYHLTTVEQLQNENYRTELEDFYLTGDDGYFIGQEDAKIHYKMFDHSDKKQVILISSGRTEAALKYKELLFDLYNNGYSVYIIDHRGQGLSDRLTENTDMGYIENFDYYIQDLKQFYDEFLAPKGFEKKYLLAHSMGGAIGMTFLEKYPNEFDAAGFSSPMLGFDFPICTAAKLFNGKEPKYALGQKDYNPEDQNFEENQVTNSEVRYDIMTETYNNNPKARLGGATYQWLDQSCKQIDYIFSHINELKTPFILLSATDEQLVNPNAHYNFVNEAKKMHKVAELYKVEDAKHELFFEKDEKRISSITTILDFFSKY